MSDDLSVVAEIVCDQLGYTNLGRVGEGAFKQTFEVEAADGAKLALKILRSSSFNDRTTREIEAMRRCQHPNIAKLHLTSTCRFNGTTFAYLVEEFLPGGTLSQRMRGHVMSSREVRELGARLISALAETASLGLVHRDIKPDNIMFRSVEGQPVLVDFGLVRDLEQTSLTKTWQPVGPGTPLFSSPEQLNNEKQLIDWRSDQFSLGVVLAMCVSGVHPYQHPGDDLGRIVERVATRLGMSPNFLQRSIIGEFPALKRMVTPWPVQRFRSPDLLADAWDNQGV